MVVWKVLLGPFLPILSKPICSIGNSCQAWASSPGEAGKTIAWSPLVRLHNFPLPSGKKIGDYNGICQAGQTGCPASYIPAASIAVASFNTIFIVAPPQQ